MALNRVYAEANQLVLTPTVAPGARALSGDPVLVGELPGAMLTDADNTLANRGRGTVQMDGAFEFPVYGSDGAADVAMDEGEIVYMGDDGVLSADDTGVRYGYVLRPVTAGRRDPILVKVGY